MWMPGISYQVIVSSEIIGRGRGTGTDYRDVSSFGLEKVMTIIILLSYLKEMPTGDILGRKYGICWELWQLSFLYFFLYHFSHVYVLVCCLHRCGACVRGDQKLKSDVFLDSSSLYLTTQSLLLNFALPGSASSDEYFAPVPLSLPLEHWDYRSLLGIFVWLLETHTLVLKFMRHVLYPLSHPAWPILPVWFSWPSVPFLHLVLRLALASQ